VVCLINDEHDLKEFGSCGIAVEKHEIEGGFFQKKENRREKNG